MRILLVSDFREIVGGAEILLYDEKKMLEKKGHVVETYFSDEKKRHRIFGSIFSLKNFVGTYKKINRFRPDVIHIHKYNLSLSASPLIAGKLKRKKTVVTFHDFGMLCANGWCVDSKGMQCENPAGIKWVFRKSLSKKKQVNRIYDYIKNKIHLSVMGLFLYLAIGPSEIMSLYLKQIFPKKDVRTVPLFISMPKKKERKRREKMILFVGRLEEEKGIRCAIEVLECLPKEMSMVIIGSGSEEALVRSMIKSRGMQKRVTFIPHLPHEKLAGFYKKASALVMPSLWLEQFGLTGIEALSHRTPVLAPERR